MIRDFAIFAAGGVWAAALVYFCAARPLRKRERKLRALLDTLRTNAGDYMRRSHQDGGIFAGVNLVKSITEADQELKRNA